MQTEWNENRIVLHGRVCQAPVPSHTNHGESYLKFPLAVCRLSGAEDRVNVVASAALLERCPEDIPVYTAAPEVLTRLTGFHLTRGMLCAMRRPTLPTVEEVQQLLVERDYQGFDPAELDALKQ